MPCLIFYLFVCSVCARVVRPCGTSAWQAFLWWLEDNLWGLVLSLHPVCVSSGFYPLSHLASSLLDILKIKVHPLALSSSLVIGRPHTHSVKSLCCYFVTNFSTVLNCDVISDMQAMWYVTPPPKGVVIPRLRTAALAPRSSVSAPCPTIIHCS